ncbi:unnamed protein product [Mytilus edulis]|uniref:Uncharacterized protein n=1 Tax=Mytilus edulis TaxID=6550 RepID=A0A8S3VDT9_MYTED|nr:unnamed protein product [Mytilus edulis]
MLREAATYGIDNRVRECAQKLQDTALLAKLSAGDLVAQEAKYHVKCLIYLYRKASRVANDDESEGGTQSRISHGIALAELVSFIEESRSEDNVAPVFKMSDLSKMYGNRLEKMGAEQEGRVHSTRLKNRLLTYVPDIEAYKQGRENLLAFKDDIGPALRRACEEDFDSNYMQIYKAVKIVRSDMMATSSEFNGTFAADCQEKSVPRSLLTLVNMLLYGPDITTDSFSQETLSIAQMLIFNSHKRIQKSNRHAKSRETPSQMYLGIVIHCQTRKRGLIDKLYKLGLSVSYDRILSVSASLTNTLCKQYQEDGYVCPPSLRLGLFTTAAVDNIDHNPSSTTAKDSFHGTGISLFQHVTTQMNGQQRLDFQLTSIQGGRVTESLPDSYAVVKPAVLKTNVPVIPVTDSTCKGCTGDLHEAVQNEYRWLETVSNSKEYDIEERTLVSWGAYHAEHEPIKDFEPCVSALLPLFEEEAKSVAMIKHSFDVIKTSVEALNPEEDEHHHENKTSVQKSFLKDIWSMVEVMNELGNPFMEDSQDLLVLDTKDIAPTSVVDTIRKIEKIGKTQTPHGKTVSAMKDKISILKSDVSLFSRLYISCQTRGGDLEDFFAHENNINPPALSQHGKMRLGTKSDLLSKCLEPLTTTTCDAPEVDALVIDGAAIVNMLKPSTSRTFDDYADLIFCPYIRKQLETVARSGCSLGCVHRQ